MFTVVLLIPALLPVRWIAGERPLIVARVEADDPGQAVRAALEIYELGTDDVGDVIVWEGGHVHGDIAESAQKSAPPPGHSHWKRGVWGKTWD